MPDIRHSSQLEATMELIARSKAFLARRPWWMNGLLLFCLYMTFIYVPWDFFSKPVAEAEEVWFGWMLTGMAAKATEPLHWLIYLAGSIGFWRMRPWMHPWAGLYCLQVAIGMLVWNLLYDSGGGLVGGLLSALPFVILSASLWRAHWRFQFGCEARR